MGVWQCYCSESSQYIYIDVSELRCGPKYYLEMADGGLAM